MTQWHCVRRGHWPPRGRGWGFNFGPELAFSHLWFTRREGEGAPTSYFFCFCFHEYTNYFVTLCFCVVS